MRQNLEFERRLAMTGAPDESSIPGRSGGSANSLGCLLLMLLAGVAAHLEFSWMGFSPTDEGWILAFSRRLLAGQVPHRDYFRVQTPGTEFFHAPELIFGGDYTFWISRLVAWLQIAVIAWAWPQIFSKLTKKDLTWQYRTVLGLICFAFTASTFPVMVWPTFDGLFFISIGLLLVLRGKSLPKLSGYFLIGLACVCKQNFIVVFPAFLLVLGDWKRIRYWAAAVLPGALYLGSMSALGALPDLLIQVGSARGFVGRAILPFLTRREVWVTVPFGLVATDLANRRDPRDSIVGRFFIYAVLVLCGLALSTELYWYSTHVSFGRFGFSLGVVLADLLLKTGDRDAATAGMLAIIVAWAIAISNGFNYPTLGCGVLTLFLVQFKLFQEFERRSRRLYLFPICLGLLMSVTLLAFYVGRHQHIYRDLPASKLTARLDGVLPGGRLLRTNPNTYAFLADLNLAISETHGTRYAIIPGFAAYWVKGPQLDPLPIDWLYFEMLPNPKMTARFLQSVAEQKGNIVLLVEKVEPTNLRQGFTPLNETAYPESVLAYVRTHFAKVGETKYFELRR
jgi:hypothetical protein